MLVFNTLYADLLFYMLSLCVFIPVWVFFLLGWQVVTHPIISLQEGENNWVEFVWTVVPTFLVAGLCFFNCQCLGGDNFLLPQSIVKVVGHQWYWSYESGFSGYYDSVIGEFIGSVNKPLSLSLYKPYLMLVTSADVIHSFALPAFNIKVDAIPGRVNGVNLFPDRLGVFVGYCSELCGAGHAYMPIVVEVIISKPVKEMC